LKKFDIKIFPQGMKEDFEDVHNLQSHVPFAVIGSTSVHQVGDQKVRGRKYRWGVAEGESHHFTLFPKLFVQLKIQSTATLYCCVNY
jgi:septin family protein